MSREDWPALKAALETVIRQKTRDEWDEIMLGTDICYAPVLNFNDAVAHPHNRERGTFAESAGITQAAPAPRFSRTPPELPSPAVAPGGQTDQILAAIGMTESDIAALRTSGAVA